MAFVIVRADVLSFLPCSASRRSLSGQCAQQHATATRLLCTTQEQPPGDRLQAVPSTMALGKSRTVSGHPSLSNSRAPWQLGVNCGLVSHQSLVVGSESGYVLTQRLPAASQKLAAKTKVKDFYHSSRQTSQLSGRTVGRRSLALRAGPSVSLAYPQEGSALGLHLLLLVLSAYHFGSTASHSSRSRTNRIGTIGRSNSSAAWALPLNGVGRSSWEIMFPIRRTCGCTPYYGALDTGFTGHRLHLAADEIARR